MLLRNLIFPLQFPKTCYLKDGCIQLCIVSSLQFTFHTFFFEKVKKIAEILLVPKLKIMQHYLQVIFNEVLQWAFFKPTLIKVFLTIPTN